MPEQNPHQTWGDGVVAKFRELRRKAKAADAVPFGSERLTKAESRERFTAMSPAEREKFVAAQGEEAVLNIWRG